MLIIFYFLILYGLLFLIRKEKNINKSIIVSEVYKKKTIYILYMKKYIIIISILSLLCIALCFRPKLKEGFECPNRLVKRDNKLNYNLSQIVVSTGAKQSLSNIAASLINPGDEVILPCPYWVSYRDIIKLNGGVPVEINRIGVFFKPKKL